MLPEAHIEVEIAVGTAVVTLAALAAQPQALAVADAARNARLEGVRFLSQPAAAVVFGQAEVEIQCHAFERLFQRDFGCDFIVLAAELAAFLLPCPTAT